MDTKRSRLLAKCKGKPIPFDAQGEEVILKPLTVRQFSEIMEKSTKFNAKGEADQDIGVNNALVAIAMVRDPETHEPVFESTDIDVLLGAEMNSPMWEIMSKCQAISANMDDSGKLVEPIGEAKNLSTETPNTEESP